MELKNTTYSSKSKEPLFECSTLLVDDNPVNVTIAKNFLQKWGADVQVAENGLEAFELFKEGAFDLIIMDLHMPVMSGLEASSLIREYEKAKGLCKENQIPIIAFTADVFIADSIFDQHGISDKIYKPFEPDALRKLMTYHTVAAKPVA